MFGYTCRIGLPLSISLIGLNSSPQDRRMEAEVSQKELMKKLMNSNSASAYVNPWLNELIGPAIIPVIMLLNPTSCAS